MTAAAPAPDLTNPSTAAVRLLAALRWFVLLLLIHWLIAGGRKLAAALRQGAAHPDFPLFTRRFGTTDPAVIRARITRGLHRAIALEAELRSTGPTDQRMADIAHRRAIAAIIIDIGRDLGVLRAAARIACRGHRVASHLNRVRGRWFPIALGQPARTAVPAACAQPAATGPPASQPRHRDAETNAGVPWNVSVPVFGLRSGGTPASFLSYALS